MMYRHSFFPGCWLQVVYKWNKIKLDSHSTVTYNYTNYISFISGFSLLLVTGFSLLLDYHVNNYSLVYLHVVHLPLYNGFTKKMFPGPLFQVRYSRVHTRLLPFLIRRGFFFAKGILWKVKGSYAVTAHKYGMCFIVKLIIVRLY